MTDNQPAAFFSYVHADDAHDGGITSLHAALHGEVSMQLGSEFPIFLDRNDISWGQRWRTRIDESLDSATLLIPVITPALFKSLECRRELTRFLERERELGRDDLVWPIYYVSAGEMDEPGDDELAAELARRQYADWRQLRFEPFTSLVVRQRLATLAEHIRDSSRAAPAHVAEKATSGHEGSQTASAAQTEPPTLVVDPYGRGDHETISEAIAAAQRGDRILVRPGLYEEQLVIDKPLELIGQGSVDEIVVTAKGGGNTIRFQTNIGRVSNLTVRQATDELWHCVKISQGRLELEDCDISSDSLACVAVHNGADPRVRRNRVHGSKDAAGVIVYEQGLGTFEDNEIFENALSGVEVLDTSSPTFRRNRIHHNSGAGVYVHTEGSGTFEHNEIADNEEAGVTITEAGRPTVRDNRIHRNGFAALLIDTGGGGIFEDNDLTDNAGGPWDIAEDSLDNVVRSGNREE